MHLAFLYSRYPVISQTFCDTEMLALERRGWSFEIGSVHPPLTSLRHEHAAQLRSPVYYAPPQEVLKAWANRSKAKGEWPVGLIARHDQRYGPGAKASLRARNAVYFAELFQRLGVEHFHVHFANRAAQTALFVKAISGIPFSITAHGQDFMVDLGSVDLLREICSEAEFVAAETDFSAGLLRQRCPESAGKVHRVYNGMNLENFPAPEAPSDLANEPVKILSIGRLVAFKGFTYLIEACAELARRGCNFLCEIVGEGPLREDLARQIQELNLDRCVKLAGALSQEEIFARLRSCQLFVLASVIDSAGASDVFPTVILEAMASARPVVSTRVAGIPESVVDGQTGLLVPPEDPVALARAMEKLIPNPALRRQFGGAGRERVEQNFAIEKTLLPLERLFAGVSAARKISSPVAVSQRKANIVYLIHRWPSEETNQLEIELKELDRQGLDILPVVCQVAHSVPPASQRDFALQLTFLPDAMVIEGDWKEECTFARELESEHSRSLQRVPSSIFLEQARYAVSLRKLLRRYNPKHVHAASSCALVAGVLLKQSLKLTLSASIEPDSPLSRTALKEMLRQCDGGRVADPQMVRERDDFLLDPPPNVLSRLFGKRTSRKRMPEFWREWSERLTSWSADEATH